MQQLRQPERACNPPTGGGILNARSTWADLIYWLTMAVKDACVELPCLATLAIVHLPGNYDASACYVRFRRADADGDNLLGARPEPGERLHRLERRTKRPTHPEHRNSRAS